MPTTLVYENTPPKKSISGGLKRLDYLIEARPLSKSRAVSDIEILLCGLEQLHVIAAVHVFVQAVGNALGMAHLAQYPPIGRSDALYGPNGAVRVHINVHSGHSVFVNVLRSNPAVCRKLPHQFIAAQEAALAMGNWNGIYIPHLRPCKPRRTV